MDFLFLLQVYDLEGQALKKCISKAIKIFNGIHGRMMKKNLENFKNSQLRFEPWKIIAEFERFFL